MAEHPPHGGSHEQATPGTEAPEEAPNDQEGRGRAIMIRIGVGLGAIALIAIAAMTLWPQWTEVEQTVTPEPIVDRGDTVVREEFEAVALERRAPKIATSLGNHISFDVIEHGVPSVEQTIVMRLLRGRADPVLFEPATISGALAGELTIASPTGGTLGDCFASAIKPDPISAQYCAFRLIWTPPTVAEEHRLSATVSWDYSAFQLGGLGMAGQREASIEDVSGGWPPQSYRMTVTGFVGKPSAPPSVSATPQEAALGDVVVQSTATAIIRLTVSDREARITGLQIVPPRNDIEIKGKQCERRFSPGTTTNTDHCDMTLTWTPTDTGTLDGHTVVIAWETIVGPTALAAGVHPDRYEAKIALGGNAQAAAQITEQTGRITLSTTALSLTGEHPAIAHGTIGEGLLEIRASNGTATVQRIEINAKAERQGVRVNTRAYGQDCVRRYVPSAHRPIDSCRVEVRWDTTATQPGVTIDDAELYVVWQPDAWTKQNVDAPPLRELVRLGGRVEGDARAGAKRAGSVHIAPAHIAFGHHPAPPGTLHRRITVRAEGADATVERVTLESERATDASAIVLNPSECISSTGLGGEARAVVRAGEGCVIRIAWSPGYANQTAASIEIVARSGEATARRHNVDLAGSTAARPVESEDALRARRLRDAQARVRARHARGMGASARRGWRVPGQTITPTKHDRRWLDPNYAQIGFDPEGGTSSRPVSLARTILSHTPIPCTIAHQVNAAMPSPIRCTVSANVYSSHGAQIVIPRGSRITGFTDPIGAGGAIPATGAAGSGATSGPRRASAGAYSAMLTAGQHRVSATWTRITLHDGTAFDVRERVVSTDTMLQGGIPAVVDPKEIETYAAVLSSRAIKALAWLAAPPKTVTVTQGTRPDGSPTQQTQTVITPEERALDEITGGIQEVADRIAAYVLPVPSLVIPPGTRIHIIPIEDLWLRDAQALRPQAAMDAAARNQQFRERAWAAQREGFARTGLSAPSPGSGQGTATAPGHAGAQGLEDNALLGRMSGESGTPIPQRPPGVGEPEYRATPGDGGAQRLDRPVRLDAEGAGGRRPRPGQPSLVPGDEEHAQMPSWATQLWDETPGTAPGQ